MSGRRREQLGASKQRFAVTLRFKKPLGTGLNKFLMYLVYPTLYILIVYTIISALGTLDPSAIAILHAFWLGSGACYPYDVMTTSFPSPTPEENVPQSTHNLGVLFGPYLLFLSLI